MRRNRFPLHVRVIQRISALFIRLWFANMSHSGAAKNQRKARKVITEVVSC